MNIELSQSSMALATIAGDGPFTAIEARPSVVEGLYFFAAFLVSGGEIVSAKAVTANEMLRIVNDVLRIQPGQLRWRSRPCTPIERSPWVEP